MTVGVLVISHNQIGKVLVETAIGTLGVCPLPIEVLSVKPQGDPDDYIAEAEQLLDAVDQGDGVIVLTDMYGSTPGNIAASLGSGKGSDKGSAKNIVIISGMNLPMLIRLMNYPDLGFEHLLQKAVSGGMDGIFRYMPQK